MNAIHDEVVKQMTDYAQSPEFLRDVEQTEVAMKATTADADAQILADDVTTKLLSSLLDQKGFDMMLVKPGDDAGDGYTVGAQFVIKF